MSLDLSNRPKELQPRELLQYLAAYRTVVCATCHYAVQPNAIGRHLKDIHHIHRSHRRPFTRYVSSLLLDEPQKVIQSKVDDFPVPQLPVEDGLECGDLGCSHLCGSIKRMQSHWISVHGRPGRASLDWHPAPLQTFFRGNLLRYFTKSPPEPATYQLVHHALERHVEDAYGKVDHLGRLTLDP